jgi:hypothetical protein
MQEMAENLWTTVCLQSFSQRRLTQQSLFCHALHLWEFLCFFLKAISFWFPHVDVQATSRSSWKGSLLRLWWFHPAKFKEECYSWWLGNQYQRGQSYLLERKPQGRGQCPIWVPCWGKSIIEWLWFLLLIFLFCASSPWIQPRMCHTRPSITMKEEGHYSSWVMPLIF